MRGLQSKTHLEDNQLETLESGNRIESGKDIANKKSSHNGGTKNDAHASYFGEKDINTHVSSA